MASFGGARRPAAHRPPLRWTRTRALTLPKLSKRAFADNIPSKPCSARCLKKFSLVEWFVRCCYFCFGYLRWVFAVCGCWNEDFLSSIIRKSRCDYICERKRIKHQVDL